MTNQNYIKLQSSETELFIEGNNLLICNDRLTTEIEALEQNTSRYKWLRDNVRLAQISIPTFTAGSFTNKFVFQGQELDEAIDAMMEKENERYK